MSQFINYVIIFAPFSVAHIIILGIMFWQIKCFWQHKVDVVASGSNKLKTTIFKLAILSAKRFLHTLYLRHQKYQQNIAE